MLASHMDYRCSLDEPINQLCLGIRCLTVTRVGGRKRRVRRAMVLIILPSAALLAAIVMLALLSSCAIKL